MCVNTSDNVQTELSRCILRLFTLPALFICIPVSFTVYTTSIVLSVKCFSIILTLSSLSLRDPLSDYPTGIIDGCGGLKLHRLHNVALANADFQRQHHHLGRRCGRGLQLHLGREGKDRAGEVEFIVWYESRRSTVIDCGEWARCLRNDFSVVTENAHTFHSQISEFEYNKLLNPLRHYYCAW